MPVFSEKVESVISTSPFIAIFTFAAGVIVWAVRRKAAKGASAAAETYQTVQE